MLDLVCTGSWTPIQSQSDRSAYRVETRDGSCFVKHYRPAHWSGVARDFWVHRKPQRAYTLATQLAEQGISTPCPLALFLSSSLSGCQALLITEWIEDALVWRQGLPQLAAESKGRRQLRAALGSMATLLGRLHRLGYYHGDLVGNLLCAESAAGWLSYLVDLEELHPRLSERRRVKNLEELGRGLLDLHTVSLRERWEFLKVYGGEAGLDAERCRHLWRRGREAQRRRLADHEKRTARFG